MIEYRLGLLGYPLEHSYSPSLHRAALEAFNLCGGYELFSIPPTPQGRQELHRLLARMRRGELQGLNVTIPHKVTAAHLLDELSQAARVIGAVNAILARDGRLVGENFDSPAFMADLSYQLERAGLAGLSNLPGRRALVLGAGGAARAVAYGLLAHGWQLKVAARRPEAAQELRQAFRELPDLNTCRLPDLANQDLDGTGLIVNATSAGMFPYVTTSAWPEQVALPAGAMVYDLVYNPTETSLLARARQAGLPACNGLGMLVRQAALSFQAWTGLLPDWHGLYRLVLPEAV